MAEKLDFGYEETLIYGKYRRDLGNFGKFQAKKIKQQNKVDFGGVEPKKINRVWLYLVFPMVRARDWVFAKVGEDWIFLTLLGIIMALLSFTIDLCIERMQKAKYWFYEELAFSVALQYFSWVLYSVVLIMFATGFTHIVSPQAIGSGIPEMKTILRGVVLKEFLTFRTLIAKVVGLTSSLGSTLPFGKEGPLVHIASIVATMLGKLSSFKGLYENESRRTEMLAAACAVGVAGTYAAPFGGVLFSIEATATYFAVRNYWRGFYSAVCVALVFRLLAFWFKDEETLTSLFKTSLKTDFPYDPIELIAFSLIGILCGFGGALFILLHRNIILFTRTHKSLSAFLQKNRFIYPGLIVVIVCSCTFPDGLGQFFAGALTYRQALDELFSNFTWNIGPTNIAEEEIISHWRHPSTNIYVGLVLFVIMNFWMAAICNTLPIPAGVFVPVFTIGAAFGRLIGEIMAACFPNGVKSGDVIHKIVPGGYAIVGAVSLSGSVTRTISTSVIVFEVTGQISHVLPAVIAVLLANAVANCCGPSFYESIINLKRLPYLPNIVSSKVNSWSVYVEDIMVKDVKYVSFVSTYNELKDLLDNTYLRTYPLVDSNDSMILLGSVKRFELERILWDHLSRDQKIFLSDDEDEGVNSTVSSPGSSRPPTPPPRVEYIPEMTSSKHSKQKPRFVVSNVDTVIPRNKSSKPKPSFLVSKVDETMAAIFQIRRPSSLSSLDEMNKQERRNSVYNINPPRSILKNASSPNQMTPIPKASSFAGELDKHLRKPFEQQKDSIVEDVPFVFNKASIQKILKHVNLPPEPVKIKNLPTDKQEAWENDQLSKVVEWEGCQIDPAPFQLVERTSLHKVHSLFSLLSLNHAYVTSTGKLVGVVALKELRHAIQGHIDAESDSNISHVSHEDTNDDDDDFLDPQQLEVDYS